VLRRTDDDVSLLDRRNRRRQIVSSRVAALAATLTLAIVACNNKHSPPVAARQVFEQRCVICHQPSAQGIPGLYPPLADSIGHYVSVKGGRQYLVHVLLNGLSGPVVVKGATYNGLMPQFAYLSDEDIALALNEVLTRFNAAELPTDFQPITPDEVKAGRAVSKNSTQLMRERAQVLSELKDAGAQGASR
jgi:mono/diheme cytochrome c family protein